MSVEALASAWARREGAPDGAAVVAGTEVAGRLRGGEPWTVGGDDALLMAVVTRPDVDPMREAVLWLPASLAAAETIAVIAGKEGLLRWPDRVVFPRGNPSACAVNVVTQLGPGRIDHSVVSLRVDKQAIAGGGGPVERDDLLIARFVARLRHHLATLIPARHFELFGYRNRNIRRQPMLALDPLQLVARGGHIFGAGIPARAQGEVENPLLARDDRPIGRMPAGIVQRKRQRGLLANETTAVHDDLELLMIVKVRRGHRTGRLLNQKPLGQTVVVSLVAGFVTAARRHRSHIRTEVISASLHLNRLAGGPSVVG